ncbi:MAG: DinB family protein, partial [Anaerolineae bacterium]
PGDGRWSIKETLAHLASAEGSHRQVAQDIAAGQTVDVPDFDLDAWNAARVAERRQRSIGQILEEMAAERQRTLSALQDLEDEAFDRQGLHPVLGETTVLKVFRIIPIHERWHLKDIRQLLEEQRERQGQ